MEQQHGDSWFPIAFFERKLPKPELKYSTYSRELLAIYSSIRHFRHFLEGTPFVVKTDYKPLIYPFKQKADKASPRQARYLTYIAEFSADIVHVRGETNVVADALSDVDAISLPTSFDIDELITEQENDEQLQQLRADNSTSLIVGPVDIGNGKTLFCDTSRSHIRSFALVKLGKRIFDASHPGDRTTLTQLRKNSFGKKCIGPVAAYVASEPKSDDTQKIHSSYSRS